MLSYAHAENFLIFEQFYFRNSYLLCWARDKMIYVHLVTVYVGLELNYGICSYNIG